MIFDPLHTVAFTGHRTYDGSADEALRLALAGLYDRGYRRFVSGMAAGFDLAAAEAVLELKAERPDAKLFCAVPYRAHGQRLAPDDRKRYERCLGAAEEVVFVSARYHAGCYALRNDFLVAQASYLLAYYTGVGGGTHYTVQQARRRGMPVENLWPDPQGDLFGGLPDRIK